MAIGETGSITTNSPGVNDPITVTFTEPLDDPILALTATSNGGDPFVLRVTDIQLDGDGNATGFTFIIEEWEYLDGNHGATETINWLAVEEGVHTLPDGRIIEAGRVDSNPGSGNTPVSLNGGFTNPPVVLTSVMSENDTTTVDSDPLNITSSGFNIQLQEEEGQPDDHASESIGYIAIQGGSGADSGSANTGTTSSSTNSIDLGDTFTNGITVAETQTINGPDPARVSIDGGNANSIDLSLQEEQSQGGETNHITETVGVVTFEAGLILCFAPGCKISTPTGPIDVVDLKKGDLVITKDNGLCPIRWVGGKRVSKTRQMVAPHLAPIHIKAGSLGNGLPMSDMQLSPQHRILMSDYKWRLYFGHEEVFVPAKSLINDTGIRQVTQYEETYYYHIMFDKHEVIYANGVETESLHPGHLAKDGLDGKARDELFEIFPELRCHPESYGQSARPVMKVQESRLAQSVLPTFYQ